MVCEALTIISCFFGFTYLLGVSTSVIVYFPATRFLMSMYPYESVVYTLSSPFPVIRKRKPLTIPSSDVFFNLMFPSFCVCSLKQAVTLYAPSKSIEAKSCLSGLTQYTGCPFTNPSGSFLFAVIVFVSNALSDDSRSLLPFFFMLMSVLEKSNCDSTFLLSSKVNSYFPVLLLYFIS